MSARATPPVGGWVAPGFERVRDVFAANFVRDDGDTELGAGLAAYHRGRCVVDLWGGHADTARDRPWARDTLINVWSATKGVVALAMAILVDQGRLRYEDTVATYWPEFAANGKENITVAQVMSHQAGLNGFREPTSGADLLDWNIATARLAAQAPFWTPGTMASYHALTVGYLAGEVIRRVTGMVVGDFVRAAIAGPLGADFHIGLPPSQDWRVAEIVGPPPPPADAPAPNEVAARAVKNPAADPHAPNSRAWRAAQVPAANGHSTAQALARIYGAMAEGGVLEGARVISEAGVDRLRQPRHPGPDQMLGPRQWAAGMSFDVAPVYGPLKETFGHTGWGGAFGCANREQRIGIGYVMNRMGSRLISNPRGDTLSAAVFACIESNRQ